jgi:hypothetical protein
MGYKIWGLNSGQFSCCDALWSGWPVMRDFLLPRSGYSTLVQGVTVQSIITWKTYVLFVRTRHNRWLVSCRICMICRNVWVKHFGEVSFETKGTPPYLYIYLFEIFSDVASCSDCTVSNSRTGRKWSWPNLRCLEGLRISRNTESECYLVLSRDVLRSNNDVL